MASEGVVDWDQPLPTSTDSGEEEEEGIDRLAFYVGQMAYPPTEPKKASERTESLAKAKPRVIVDTYRDFGNIYLTKERGERMKRLASMYSAIPAEKIGEVLRIEKLKQMKKQCLEAKKQILFYDMVNKLELQCRTQYLNFLIRKFADFIANMATSMEIPAELAEPYGRMQRGIFCNIIKLIGIKPTSPSAFFYNSKEAVEYKVCHNLAHALLSLIIKALDAAVKKDPKEPATGDCDMEVLEMDNYIKERLMCAAKKKLRNCRKRKETISKVYEKCDEFARGCSN